MHTFTHRVRRAILLTVGVAITALAALPAAALADISDNTGAVAAGETRASKDQCSMYYGWYSDDLKAGAQQDAAYDKKLAGSRGCTWAQAAPAPPDGVLSIVAGQNPTVLPSPPAAGAVSSNVSAVTALLP